MKTKFLNEDKRPLDELNGDECLFIIEALLSGDLEEWRPELGKWWAMESLTAEGIYRAP